MFKKEKSELSSEMIITDILLRLKSIENLLIAKGIFTQDEFHLEMNSIAVTLAKSILHKAKVPGDIDELIKGLQDQKKVIDN